VSRPTVVLSYGLGVDSTAILLRWLLIPSSRDFDLRDLLVITAMTGNEWPRTGELVVKYILPLLRKNHVRYVQVARAGSRQEDGVDVLDDSRHPTQLFLAGSYTLADELLAGGTVVQLQKNEKRGRICTQKAKGWPMDQFVSRATEGQPYRHVVGYELEEPERAEGDLEIAAKRRAAAARGEQVMLPERIPWFPLIEWGWDREACKAFIWAHLGEWLGSGAQRTWEGIDWPKSACFFCPFALSSMASRKEIVERLAADPKLGILTLTMERVSVALNPLQGIRGKLRMSDEVRRHAPKLWAAFERSLERQPHALYAASRAYTPYIDKKGRPGENASRQLVKLAEGTREEMERKLARQGRVERDRDGIPTVWIVRRAHPPKTARDREQLLAVAPATAIGKTGPAFDTKWVAAAQLAGEAEAIRKRLPIRS
jgi:hypothetical protein